MQVKIEKGKIRLSFKFDRDIINLCKHAGMRWSKYRKDWFIEDVYINRVCINKVFPGLMSIKDHSETKELVVPDYLMEHQANALSAATKCNRMGLYHDTGCHASGTGILMADGHIKKVEDVVVGDMLMGENGLRTVLSLKQGRETMYEIIPVKGNPFVVNESHILSLHTYARKYVKGSWKETGKNKYTWFSFIQNISVKDYLKKSITYQGFSKLRCCGVPEFLQSINSEDLTIRPYHLGLFLGDGSMERGPAIHNRHEEIYPAIEEIAKQFNIGIRKKEQSDSKGVSYFFTNGINAEYTENPIQHEFRKLGIDVHCRNKFIPHIYKTSSYDDRLELIAGLIDTDGYLSCNTYEYVSASKKLADDMTFVCRSVGLHVTISHKIVKDVTYYRLNVSGDTDKIPCRREKKKATTRMQIKSVLVTGFEVNKLDVNDYYGFTLDGDHLYLTEDFIVHHNCGKTLEALEIIKYHNVKTLVVCPLSLIEGAWIPEAHKWHPEIATANLWAEKKKSPIVFNRALQKNLCVINYEAFRTLDKKLSTCGFEMIILDESARIKSPKSSTAKKIISFCDSMKYVYLLSGVPAPNSELDYFNQIRAIDPTIWGRSFYKFQTKYFYQPGPFKWAIKKEYKNQLMADIKTVAEYVDKADVLDLPERTTSHRVFQLSPKEHKHYNEIKKYLVTMIDEGEAVTAPSAVTAIMKLRQLSSGFLLDEDKFHDIGDSKIKEMLQLIEDIGKKQVIIWIQFKHEAVMVKDALKKKGFDSGILNSTTTESEKQKYLKDFKAGNLQYIICHPKSVGYGHTLVNCSEAIYFSYSYSYDDDYQSRDRIYRYGQQEQCSYYYLVADKTIDSAILNSIRGKGNASMAILDYLKNKS